ncbi:cell wall surface anchor family protein [Oceaniovalibus guishaninsula JLT2003]|uniref:Cell wall surface anchor family protein n=1 Tax=Oceaniovalibus guishaninsula JLT2003 TaxID=1231392 RepID=K2HTD1_9RHOB|nr:cell wall surface anchor family protein [Oceaniovalibus guishaninsula JLT2003]
MLLMPGMVDAATIRPEGSAASPAGRMADSGAKPFDPPYGFPRSGRFRPDLALFDFPQRAYPYGTAHRSQITTGRWRDRQATRPDPLVPVDPVDPIRPDPRPPVDPVGPRPDPKPDTGVLPDTDSGVRPDPLDPLDPLAPITPDPRPPVDPVDPVDPGPGPLDPLPVPIPVPVPGSLPLLAAALGLAGLLRFRRR